LVLVGAFIFSSTFSSSVA